MDDSLLRIEVDEIYREENANGVNPFGGNNPNTLVRLQMEAPSETLQASQRRISRLDMQAQERLACLIEDTIIGPRP